MINVFEMGQSRKFCTKFFLHDRWGWILCACICALFLTLSFRKISLWIWRHIKTCTIYFNWTLTNQSFQVTAERNRQFVTVSKNDGDNRKSWRRIQSGTLTEAETKYRPRWLCSCLPSLLTDWKVLQ